jgi:hypothetical protein
MHLIWTNLIPNLMLLWTGKFKDLDHGDCGYTLGGADWELIGALTEASGKTIPAAFGARVPNIAQERSHFTAEMCSIWTVFMAPTLLQGRFLQRKFYDHFLELVKLLKLCLEFELSRQQVDELEEGFRKWVVSYEKYAVCASLFLLLIVFIGSIINMTPFELQPVLSLSTPSFTLRHASGRLVLSGRTGRSPWNASVGI